MTTTENLIERAEFRFGDTANALVTEAQWLDYLQDAYDEGNSFSPFWPFYEVIDTSVAISVGSNSASLETEQAGSWRVKAVHNATDNYPLAPLVGTPYHDFPTLSADKGSPEVYRLVANTLEVYPYPDHAVTLRVEVLKPPSALVNDTTSPIWPPEFHDLLVEGALAQAYRDDGNEAWAEMHDAKFQAGLVKMEEALLSGARGEFYPQVFDVYQW